MPVWGEVQHPKEVLRQREVPRQQELLGQQGVWGQQERGTTLARGLSMQDVQRCQDVRCLQPLHHQSRTRSAAAPGEPWIRKSSVFERKEFSNWEQSSPAWIFSFVNQEACNECYGNQDVILCSRYCTNQEKNQEVQWLRNTHEIDLYETVQSHVSRCMSDDKRKWRNTIS